MKNKSIIIFFICIFLVKIHPEKNFYIKISNNITKIENDFLIDFHSNFNKNLYSDFVSKSIYQLDGQIEEKREEREQEIYLEELIKATKKPSPKIVFEGLDYEKVENHSQKMKKWTILIYIAGDNNLYKFALRNIIQLKEIGSSELLNLVIHFDYHISNKPKETKRFFVKRDKLLQVGELKGMDSGSDQTLIDACSWAIKNYPSENFALVLWNHGSGDLNPISWGSDYRGFVNPYEMFFFNAETRKIELDRNVSYTDFLNAKARNRGICFDDSTGHYLDDFKLSAALAKISSLLGKKIDILLMDACLMAGIGAAYSCYPYVKYLTSSQEVVMGPGYNYALMLKPLAKRIYTPEQFIKHIIKSYKMTYGSISNDYTQSCINLSYTKELSDEIDELCDFLIKAIKIDKKDLIRKTLLICANKKLVTCFSEPAYIDLKHFLENVIFHSSKINITLPGGNNFYTELLKIINKILALHSKLIIENVCGSTLSRASGLSIYFPSEIIHPTFGNTMYGKNSKWHELLTNLLEH